MAGATFKLQVDIPAELHHRTKVVEKRLHTSRSQFIRDAIFERVETLEQKFKREEEDKWLARSRHRSVRLGTVGAKALGISFSESSFATRLAATSPSLPDLAETAADARADVELKADLAAVYTLHAREILAAGSDEVEVRRRVLRAVESVKRHCPLTHPGDKEILISLEKVVVALHRAQPQASTLRSYDDLVGAVVDVTKVKTSGKATPDPEAPDEA